MGRRKGELSKAQINRLYPHQIALEARLSARANYTVVEALKDDLSACSRGHSFFKNDEWFNVHCFSEKEHAEKFKEQFGGEWFDPKKLGRGHRWHLLKE